MKERGHHASNFLEALPAHLPAATKNLTWKEGDHIEIFAGYWYHAVVGRLIKSGKSAGNWRITSDGDRADGSGIRDKPFAIEAKPEDCDWRPDAETGKGKRLVRK